MRKYYQVVLLHWQLRMVYRTNALLEAAGNLLTMLVSITLWLFVFRQTGGELIGGYTQSEMISYLLISGLLTSTLWYTSQGDQVVDSIREGRFSKYLVKPISFSLNHFIAVITGNIARFIFSVACAGLILALFHFSAVLLLPWSHILLFLIFLLLAILIQFMIFYGAALLAFWMEEVWGIQFMFRVFADIAAGTFIPLALFAPFWRNIFDVLPFKYIVSVPVNALLGRLPSQEIMPAIIGSVSWFFVLLFLTLLIWKRGVRHYSAVGD